MNRLDRLANMDLNLQLGLSTRGNERTQRACLHRIIIDSYATGTPILEWLAGKLGTPQPPEAPAAPERYQCPACHKGFASKDALNGHGPKRCKGKEAGP